MKNSEKNYIERKEFENRTKLIQKFLKKKEYDAILVYADAWRTSNVAYFVDYRAFDGILPIYYAFILITQAAIPQLFLFPPCLPLANSTWLKEATPIDNLIPCMIDLSNNQRWRRLAVAGHSIMSAEIFEKILTGLKGISVEPVEFLNRIKSKKSPKEISLMLEAGRLTEIAMNAIHDALKTGQRTERELAAIANYEMVKSGADGPAFDTMIQSGPNSSMNLMRPTDRIVMSGDMILVDVGARFHGYSSDIGRGICFGEVSSESKNIALAALDAFNSGIASVKPGVKVKTIHAAIRNNLRESGYEKYFNEAAGHGIGHDPEEEVPFIVSDSEQKLERDMTLVVKSALMVPEIGGIRIEDVIVVRDNGAEMITDYPRKLFWSV